MSNNQVEDCLVSLCMIARNNEKTIGAAIRSAVPWVDEVIVVDTGSVDRTPELAEELGAKVFFFPWCDDFSAARNHSLAHARGRWIFWMDTDDTLPAHCGMELRNAVSQAKTGSVLGLIMQVKCPADSHFSSEKCSTRTNGARVGGAPTSDQLGDSREPETDSPDHFATVVDHVKIIRNLPHIRFEGRIHEQVLPSIRRLGGEISWTDLYVVHSGADYSKNGLATKLQRDLRLLRLEERERPNHPFVLFNLGMTLLHSRELDEARSCLQRCISNSMTDESHLRKAYVLLVESLEQIGDSKAALGRCWEGLGRFPNDTELSFKLGRLHMNNNRWEEALEAFDRVLAPSQTRYFASIDPTIREFKVHANRAICFYELGNHCAAQKTWARCLDVNPRFDDAWDGILESCRKDRAADFLYDMADRFSSKLLGLPYPELCKAVATEISGDVQRAIELFEGILVTAKNSIIVLDAYARLLLTNNRPESAIQILERLLELNKSCPSTHFNLGIAFMMFDELGKAIDFFKASLSLRPNHEQTLRHLKQCVLRIREANSSELISGTLPTN